MKCIPIIILDHVEMEKGADYEEIIIPPDSPESPRIKRDAMAYESPGILQRKCFFYTAFSCFAKRVFIEVPYEYYHIIFNRYVYSVDGKRFVGLYNPKFPNYIDISYDIDDYNPDYQYCIPCLLWNNESIYVM